MSQIDPSNIRQIHLDFHTPGFVTVGDKFDVNEFYNTLEASKVNSIAVFAKCHHGYSYFDTQIGTRHPGMSIDMFGEAAVEAKRRGIDFLGYFSLNVDEVIAEQHPEWVALHKDGSPVDSQILQDGSELYWRWLCPNRGGYFDEFFFPHVEECLAKYPMDGIFIDMAGYLPDSCFCDACVASMREQGLDPDNSQDHNRFNSANMQAFAKRLREVMDRYRPGMRLEVGSFNAWGEADKARGVISEFYVESLAFQTGWFNFPFMGRYLSGHGLPVMGMTGRFLKNWGDFGTVVSPHQLKMQLATHLSIGASCCVGDHIHCNGRLDPAVYSIIGDAFSFVEERQRYCSGMTRAREVAILVPGGVETNTAVANKKSNAIDIWDSVYGAAKLMMEGHYQWDVIDPDCELDGLSCAVLVHPFVSAGYIDKLEKWVNAGGTLVVDSGAVLVTGDLTDRWNKFIGLKSAAASAYPGAFYKVTGETLADGVPEMAHYVHSPSVELNVSDDAVELAQAAYSPCVRSREAFYGHFHGPDTVDGGAAISSVKRGDGRVVVLGQSVMPAYLNTGYFAHRKLMHNLFDNILSAKTITTDAPSIMEITVGEKDRNTVIQFLSFVSDRRHRYSFESLNEAIPICGVNVKLRTDRAVSRVWNPVSGEDIEFKACESGIEFQAPAVADHLVLLIS